MTTPPLFRRLLALLALTASLAAAEEGVPLPLTLPRPLFVGTPRPIRVPNLEKPRIGRRPDFLAPVGTVNLALHRTVTSSDPLPVIGDLSFVTDGDKSGTEGSWVELGPGVQWVQIDLGAPAVLTPSYCGTTMRRPASTTMSSCRSQTTLVSKPACTRSTQRP